MPKCVEEDSTALQSDEEDDSHWSTIEPKSSASCVVDQLPELPECYR